MGSGAVGTRELRGSPAKGGRGRRGVPTKGGRGRRSGGWKGTARFGGRGAIVARRRRMEGMTQRTGCGQMGPPHLAGKGRTGRASRLDGRWTQLTAERGGPSVAPRWMEDGAVRAALGGGQGPARVTGGGWTGTGAAWRADARGSEM
jgi:hypothetical protein